MAPDVAALLYLVMVVGAIAGSVRWLFSASGRRFRERVEVWLEHRRVDRIGVLPEGRPIEVIAADVRRLALRFHGLDPRTPFPKADAVRQAYDKALAECCGALDVTHLLGVIMPGPELDTERTRVEVVLEGAGLSLPSVF